MEPLIANPTGIRGMTTEPMTLEDAKTYLSIRPDDTSSDAFVQESITVCRAILERHIHYYVSTGQVQSATQPRDLRGGQYAIAVKGPMTKVTGARMTGPDGSTVPIEVTPVDRQTVRVTVPDRTEGPISITVDYSVGYIEDPVVNGILAAMIRNRYDRRTEDPYTAEVERMTFALKRINI